MLDALLAEFEDVEEPAFSRDTSSASIAIVGMGYVGLPTALSYMDAGFAVRGVDVSQRRLDAIRRQDVDLLERDLERLRQHLSTQALSLTADAAALSSASTVIICVPTPVDANLVPDLSALRGACAAVVDNATAGMTIILTSTTYVGCTRDLLIEPLAARGFAVGHDIHVAFSPERIDPGVANHRPEDTPRVVGGYTPGCLDRAVAALSPTCKSLHRVSSPEVAEMSKLLENTFRAVNIALVNEFADASMTLGVDVTEVIEAAASKPYGFMKFVPGPGVGGHCIPCDPHYLLWQLKSDRKDAPVIDAAMKAIAARPGRVVGRIIETLAEAGVPLSSARIHVVGLTFKAGVADLRESPALEILGWLVERGVQVSYSDDFIPEVVIGSTRLTARDQAPDGTDLVVVLTVHPDSDLTWVDRSRLVLDASFRLPGRVRV